MYVYDEFNIRFTGFLHYKYLTLLISTMIKCTNSISRAQQQKQSAATILLLILKRMRNIKIALICAL